MAASDVLVTKPGGLSATESAVCEIPTVLTTPIPGWEEENVAFFTSHGLARFASTPEEIGRQVRLLMEDWDARNAMAEHQRQEINKQAASEIIDVVARKKSGQI